MPANPKSNCFAEPSSQADVSASSELSKLIDRDFDLVSGQRSVERLDKTCQPCIPRSIRSLPRGGGWCG